MKLVGRVDRFRNEPESCVGHVEDVTPKSALYGFPIVATLSLRGAIILIELQDIKEDPSVSTQFYIFNFYNSFDFYS
jgi:hypothetical protein